MIAREPRTYVELRWKRMDEKGFYVLLYNLLSSSKFRRLFSEITFLRKCKGSPYSISIYNAEGDYIGNLPEKLNLFMSLEFILDTLENLVNRKYVLSPKVDSIMCENTIFIGEAIVNEPIVYLCGYGEEVRIKAREISLFSRTVVERMDEIQRFFEDLGYHFVE